MSTIIKESAADAILVIDALSRKYSNARQSLTARVKEYNDAAEQLRLKHFPGIKDAAERAAERQAELAAETKKRPDLFVKPRTMTLHGIKVGFKKGAGKIVWDDEEKVVERIRAQFSKAKAETLLVVKTTPSKDALLTLDAAALKKLGCTIEDTGDQVVIKAPVGDLEKIVAKLLEQPEDAEA
jgi:hypothetical protein